MTDHFQYIYAHRAAEYHRMIAPEDVDSNLLPALLDVTALSGKRILDLGGGTGRIPLLLESMHPEIVSLDFSRAMLLEQAVQRSQAGGSWPLLQADIRRLPFPSAWAEVIVAGWSIGHLTGWYAQNWQVEIGQVLNEMHRVARPGGALIILETLTTGSLQPAPPSSALAAYYAWLEGQWGFRRAVIATDYQFKSVDQAVEYTEFFFGSELAQTIRERAWARLPEWTGVWSKKVDQV